MAAARSADDPLVGLEAEVVASEERQARTLTPSGTARGLVFAASSGGHLELLTQLVAASPNGVAPELWVTANAKRAEDVARKHGGRAYAVPDPKKGRRQLMRNVVGAVRIALRERPQVVVTSGAAAVVPFCLAAMALGARVYFLETMARVGDTSSTGRLLSRMARRVFVQWPENRELLPSAEVCRPLLLEGLGDQEVRQPTVGTLVLLGTHHQAFDRLIDVVMDAVAADVLPGPVIVQSGVTPVPDADGVATSDIIPSAELVELLAVSRVVVGHGGAGILAQAIRAGHRPMVMARQADLDEHTDDHQAQIVDKLVDLGLAVRIDSDISERDVTATQQQVREPRWPDDMPSLGSAVWQALDRERLDLV